MSIIGSNVVFVCDCGVSSTGNFSWTTEVWLRFMLNFRIAWWQRSQLEVGLDTEIFIPCKFYGMHEIWPCMVLASHRVLIFLPTSQAAFTPPGFHDPSWRLKIETQAKPSLAKFASFWYKTLSQCVPQRIFLSEISLLPLSKSTGRCREMSRVPVGRATELFRGKLPEIAFRMRPSSQQFACLHPLKKSHVKAPSPNIHFCMLIIHHFFPRSHNLTVLM